MDPSRWRSPILMAVIGIALVLAAVAIACSRTLTPVAEQATSEGLDPTPSANVASDSGDGQADSSTYLLFNQKWLEGLSTGILDLEDVDEVFWHIFSRLPDEVLVYPSENYYYFILYANQRQLWGNIRLPAGRRERGVLSFAYFEFRESPFVTDPRVSRAKFYTDADGLSIEELDEFTYRVRYNRKEVTFNLHQLSQEPPNLFGLAEDEVYVERTFDESGFQFFLLFNETKNYFLWVLNEEELVPDNLELLEEGPSDLLVGRRSGFAFWVDEANDNRKILVAIRGQNATVNNYYDGPFDQLADNYVDQNRVSEYMMRASPSLRGRIDKFGYFTDTARPSRVSISSYYVYFTESALRLHMQRLRETPDPYFFISRRGRVDTPTPSPSPSSASP